MKARSRCCPGNASANSSSARPSPYISAVSSSVMPRSSESRTVAISSARLLRLSAICQVPRPRAATFSPDGSVTCCMMKSPIDLVSHRQAQDRPQAPHGRIREDKVAAMAARNVAGDGEAQPDTAGLRIARFLEAIERPEYFFPLLGRHARPVVVHGDFDGFRVALGADPDIVGIALGVADEVGEGAPHRLGAQGGGHIRRYL